MNTKAESAPVPGTRENTRLLEQMRAADPDTAEELLSHVYRELRREVKRSLKPMRRQ
jgi:hypothetical protein